MRTQPSVQWQAPREFRMQNRKEFSKLSLAAKQVSYELADMCHLEPLMLDSDNFHRVYYRMMKRIE